MKKTCLALLLTLLLLLLPVVPALAAEEGSGGSVGSGGTVENVAPVIEQGSLVVQIVDGEGVAWGWSAAAGNDSGDRTMPYILGGEQLHFELEVSDANGEDDLNAMQVIVHLGPDIFGTGSLVTLNIDPDAGISKGTYAGNLVADDNMPTGKYDITIDATDPASATDTYDPVIYEPGADILRPALSLLVDKSNVLFPESRPGDEGIASTDNPVSLTPLAVIGDEHIPVVFSLSHTGVDMVNGGNVIPASSIVWAVTDSISSDGLSSDYKQTIASGVSEGTTIQVYYWLNVPTPLATGDYSGQINYFFTAD
jgi:hypothetical protein